MTTTTTATHVLTVTQQDNFNDILNTAGKSILYLDIFKTDDFKSLCVWLVRFKVLSCFNLVAVKFQIYHHMSP